MASADKPVTVVALLCRTSDRAPLGAVSAQALAEELAVRGGVAPRLIGKPESARDGAWADDLRDGRGCLLEAGGQLSDALRAGAFPILTAPDCTIAMTTLRELGRERPGAVVLWLDAHADFNSPQSTESGFLGGMCLSGACGVWEPGLTAADPVASKAVVLAGVRELDVGELPLLDIHRVVRAGSTDEVIDQIADRDVYIHLDLDVLDPEVLPGAMFPVEGGLDADDLLDLLESVCEEASDVIGIEITGLGSPEHAQMVADMVAPVLDR